MRAAVGVESFDSFAPRGNWSSVGPGNRPTSSFMDGQISECNADPGVTTMHYAQRIPSEGWTRCRPCWPRATCPLNCWLARLTDTVPTGAYTSAKAS